MTRVGLGLGNSFICTLVTSRGVAQTRITPSSKSAAKNRPDCTHATPSADTIVRQFVPQR